MRTDSSETDVEAADQREWYRFGVVLSLLWPVFVLAVVLLLGVDTVFALAFAVVVSTVGGVAVTLYLLYWRR